VILRLKAHLISGESLIPSKWENPIIEAYGWTNVKIASDGGHIPSRGGFLVASKLGKS